MRKCTHAVCEGSVLLHFPGALDKEAQEQGTSNHDTAHEGGLLTHAYPKDPHPRTWAGQVPDLVGFHSRTQHSSAICCTVLSSQFGGVQNWAPSTRCGTARMEQKGAFVVA
eukprot:scaffold157698_cov19-Tisochrysis_lutea.AAC.1